MIVDIDRPENSYTPEEAAKICLKNILLKGYFEDEIDSRFKVTDKFESEAIVNEIKKIGSKLIRKHLQIRKGGE